MRAKAARRLWQQAQKAVAGEGRYEQQQEKRRMGILRRRQPVKEVTRLFAVGIFSSTHVRAAASRLGWCPLYNGGAGEGSQQHIPRVSRHDGNVVEGPHKTMMGRSRPRVRGARMRGGNTHLEQSRTSATTVGTKLAGACTKRAARVCCSACAALFFSWFWLPRPSGVDGDGYPSSRLVVHSMARFFFLRQQVAGGEGGWRMSLQK